MIANRKEFVGGLGMMSIFIIVLIVLFMPLFEGKNALDYLDALYNSISKGSAYYIPKVKEEADRFTNTSVSVILTMADEKQARQTALLFEKGGSSVEVSGKTLKVSGDLGKMLANGLADADIMYQNDGQKIAEKYGYPEKHVLYNWWRALQAMDKNLKKQEKFKAAKVVDLVMKKAVESAYNYYGVEPQKISDRIGVVLLSLFFYVVYTLWYGFAVLYMFEGWGLKLGH